MSFREGESMGGKVLQALVLTVENTKGIMRLKSFNIATTIIVSFYNEGLISPLRLQGREIL